MLSKHLPFFLLLKVAVLEQELLVQIFTDPEELTVMLIVVVGTPGGVTPPEIKFETGQL